MDIAQTIDDAFSKREYPGDDCLGAGVTEPVTAPFPEYEAARVAGAYRERHWRDLVRAGSIGVNFQAVSFLTPRAFAFYLPAYMILVVRDFQEHEELAHLLLQKLSQSDDKVLKHCFPTLVAQFSDEEKRAIAQFWQWIREAHPGEFKGFFGEDTLELAMKQYWNDFLAPASDSESDKKAKRRRKRKSKAKHREMW